MEVSVGFLLDELSRLIEPSLKFRRSSLEVSEGVVIPQDAPVTEDEIDAFLVECPFENDDIYDALMEGDMSQVLELTDDDLTEFRGDVESWSNTNNWIAADGPFFVVSIPNPRTPRKVLETRYSEITPSLLNELSIHAPSLKVMNRILDGHVDVDKLTWRELEKLIAELLIEDGYEVELRGGSKDEGADVIAFRAIPGAGLIKTVWQAKHLQSGRKVGLSIVRELADVRREHGASKGIIVTSSYLTRGAIQRIKRDQYVLGKCDRDELDTWIDRVLRMKRGPYPPA